ncbi:MAG: hypothetical protein H6729_03055 [Deltaproteobacteria bacterium]|nr:hypothetical protein [Deltaproteobacteria bacterium]
MHSTNATTMLTAMNTGLTTATRILLLGWALGTTTCGGLAEGPTSRAGGDGPNDLTDEVSLLTAGSAVINVRSLGATGNGTSDDTTAVQTALNRVRAAGGGTVYFPPGLYRITRTISVAAVSDVDIRGEGRSSTILWATNADLFRFTGYFRQTTVQNLTINAVTTIQKDRFAFRCVGGAERALFDNLLFRAEAGASTFPSGISLGDPADSTTIRDTQMWTIAGKGVEMGAGSEVRIVGGRIIGYRPATPNGSIGLHLLGNNGGVHVDGIDLIGLQYGILTENLAGRGSNRELFIRQATLDGCWRGLSVMDSTYVNVAGLWAASCSQENIYVGFGGPTLVLSGGTIFNAGAIKVTDPGYGAHGMTVNSGTFMLSGVAIRNNYNPTTNPRGRGLFVPNSNAVNYTVTGCQITDNGQGVEAATGGRGVFVGNVIARNPIASRFAPGSVLSANMSF